uniref:26S proteasome non-ATPase regulatory subunit 13 n=1 Tax=Brugia timori TaxID=42155 RepID=A0A0R3R607_9BILA
LVHITSHSSLEEVLNEADRRLKEVRNKMLRQIAEELYSLDHYYYLKSYDWALEEYIEALAFYKFLISGEVLLYSEIIDILQFADLVSEENKKFYIELPEITYLMGLFDVGGELMRLAISEISAGNSNTAVNIVNYMRSLHGCYEFLGNIVHTAEWTKKSQVFRDCLMKVENALYKWKIRENDMLIDASLLTIV